MESLKWQVADMLGLPFQAEAFGAVIEKGTMDALFVSNRPETPIQSTSLKSV